MYQNNLGCIHFFMKKYNLAVSYLKKAFDENAVVLKKLPPIDKSKNNFFTNSKVSQSQTRVKISKIFFLFSLMKERIF